MEWLRARPGLASAVRLFRQRTSSSSVYWLINRKRLRSIMGRHSQKGKRLTAERRRYWRPDMSFLVYPRAIVRHSLVRAVVAGLLIGSAMLIAQIAMDSLTGPTERTLLLSDLFVGVITAIVTGAGLRHYEAHLRADEARMHMIAEMNHHVRNALTAIS